MSGLERLAENEWWLCYGTLQKTSEATMIRVISALVVCIAVWFIGCAAPQPIEPSLIGKALLGKSKQELVSCAGNPLQETTTAEGTVLKYYKEASMLEESFPFSKGSRAGAHQGCWASLLLVHDRVIGVEFSAAPSTLNTDHLCKKIFETCGQ